MQQKKWIFLIMILFLFSATFLFLLNAGKLNSISGRAVGDIQISACEYAEQGGTCFTRLEELGLITAEECCNETGYCCNGQYDDGVSIETGEGKINMYETRETNDTRIIKGISPPEGYDLIYDPFNFECQQPIHLIINVPIKYKDVKILKCEGDKCYLKTIEKTIVTKYGELTIEKTKETEELKPELIDLKAEEIKLNITSFQDFVNIGGSEFYGEFFNNLSETLNHNQTLMPENDLAFENKYRPSEPSRDAIILIHGLATTKKPFNYLITDINHTKQPFQVWTFTYSSTRYIDEIAQDLSEAIEKNVDNYDRIYIIAHSMGGLIAQQALYDAEKSDYSYVNKVKKVILIATPNEGSVVAEAYEYLFSTLVQKSIPVHEIFRINKKFIDDLTKGRIIPRIKGAEYHVIAGTGRYTEGAISMVSKSIDPSVKFDGVVTVQSAQNVGGEYVNDMCENYWEVNMTHMELVDHPLSRQIIGEIISSEISETKEKLLGNNKYYKFDIEECSADTRYLVLGKKADQKEDIIICDCGDNICSGDEDKFNCPVDCALFSPNQKKILPLILISMIITFVIGFLVWKQFFNNKQN
ncbi:MAG: alpha/beta fold hydrolase [Candidatus Woesearchaeota archaeon]